MDTNIFTNKRGRKIDENTLLVKCLALDHWKQWILQHNTEPTL